MPRSTCTAFLTAFIFVVVEPDNEYRGFSLIVFAWLTWSSAILYKSFRDYSDFNLWLNIPQEARGKLVKHVLGLTDGAMPFRIFTYVCFFGSSLATLIWVWTTDFGEGVPPPSAPTLDATPAPTPIYEAGDVRGKLLFTVVYVFSLNSGIALAKVIDERTVSGKPLHAGVNMQYDLCAVTTFAFACSMVYNSVMNQPNMPMNDRLFLGTSSSFGIITSLGPGIVAETDDMRPSEIFTEYAEYYAKLEKMTRSKTRRQRSRSLTRTKSGVDDRDQVDVRV